MGRLKRAGEGFTLLELVIAIALSAVVLLAASNLLINFGRFSSNVVKSEASLMGTSLGAFEEIVRRINHANQVAGVPLFGTSSTTITITVDEGTPTAHDYKNYTYWQVGSNILRTGDTGDPAAPAGRIIAEGIVSLSFSRADATQLNAIVVALEAQAQSGAKNETSKEVLRTTAIMRSRSANLP